MSPEQAMGAAGVVFFVLGIIMMIIGHSTITRARAMTENLRMLREDFDRKMGR